MSTLLFFNDRNLYLSEGFVRDYGKPEPLYDCAYSDGKNYAASLPQVFRENGRYYMLYGANDSASGKHVYLIAESDDGLHFRPCNDAAARAGLENPVLPYQVLDTRAGEIGVLLKDEAAPAEERYKLLMCYYEGGEGERMQDDRVFVSPDGFRFRQLPGIWHRTGTEPGVGGFYNREKACWEIIARPDAGNRKICRIETKDFRTFTDPELMMEATGEDVPMSELYGMPVFEYKGYYIGLLQVYYPPANARERKYRGGQLLPQLTFSRGGAFTRCLNRPFFRPGEPGADDAGMIFATGMYRDKEGKITFMAACTRHEHGWFSSSEDCVLLPYHLREDGFVAMRAENEGTLCTNTMLLQGDDLYINLEAEEATCALYVKAADKLNSAEFKEAEGFSHKDCKPFSGDSTQWRPDFGKPISALKNQVILVEVKVKRGSIYAVAGDFTPMQLMDVMRWDLFKTFPKHPENN